MPQTKLYPLETPATINAQIVITALPKGVNPETLSFAVEYGPENEVVLRLTGQQQGWDTYHVLADFEVDSINQIELEDEEISPG